MKKPIIVAVGACFAFMALASAAWATITITQAPAGQPSPGYYKNLSPWGTGGTCPGNGGNAYASSDRIRLGFGWFANNPGGLKGFFQNTHGSVSITGTDTFSDSWARSKSGSPFVTTRGITWTSGEPGTGTPPGGGTVTGVASFYRGVLAIGPGTYTLSVTLSFDNQVSDGWVKYPAKSTVSGTCTFTVNP